MNTSETDEFRNFLAFQVGVSAGLGAARSMHRLTFQELQERIHHEWGQFMQNTQRLEAIGIGALHGFYLGGGVIIPEVNSIDRIEYRYVQHMLIDRYTENN